MSLYLNMIIAFFMGALLSQVWSIANILQIITHYPLLRIPIASNSIEIFELINICVTFDIIPESALEYISVFEFESDVVFTERFANLGYDSSYLLAAMYSQLLITGCGTLYYVY